MWIIASDKTRQTVHLNQSPYFMEIIQYSWAV
jgi:hypothetical protein